MLKQKNFRVENQILQKFAELKKIYNPKSDNQLFELIVEDIYQLKKSYEELDKKDVELKKAFFELGKLKNAVEEREKMINELKKEVKERNKELEKEKNKGFWARLFGK